jgi:hypothetical protein
MRDSFEKESLAKVNHELIDFAYTILDDHVVDESEIYLTSPFARLDGLFEVDPEAYADTWDCPRLYVAVQLGRSTLKGESAYLSLGRDTDPANRVHIFVDNDEVKAIKGSIGDPMQLDIDQAKALQSELNSMMSTLNRAL